MIESTEIEFCVEGWSDSVVKVRSPLSYSNSIEALKLLIEANGLQLYGQMDYQKQASDIGVKVRPTSVFMFGAPTIDVPLVSNSETIGLALPHAFLMFEDKQGCVWLAYRNFQFVSQACQLPESKNLINGVSNLIQNIAIDLAEMPATREVH